MPRCSQAHGRVNIVQASGHAAMRSTHGAKGYEIRSSVRRQEHAQEEVNVEGRGGGSAVRDCCGPHASAPADAGTLRSRQINMQTDQFATTLHSCCITCCFVLSSLRATAALSSWSSNNWMLRNDRLRPLGETAAGDGGCGIGC